jgi:predicted Fe-Mo cluster-binding NifX family protein
MKIALPSNKSTIDSHFGHCEYFTVFTVDERKKIVAEQIVDSPAGCGCKSNIAGTLSQLGVTTMLAGNMGDGAINVLSHHGIAVVRGCEGNVRDVAERWLQGQIDDSGIGCQVHEHGCAHH